MLYETVKRCYFLEVTVGVVAPLVGRSSRE
jgi:hypothetical protein